MVSSWNWTPVHHNVTQQQFFKFPWKVAGTSLISSLVQGQNIVSQLGHKPGPFV